jgi:hypothetical protein
MEHVVDAFKKIDFRRRAVDSPRPDESEVSSKTEECLEPNLGHTEKEYRVS